MGNSSSAKPTEVGSSVDTLFARGGDMAARMAKVDWEATPLGKPEGWPPSLRAAIRIMLTSRYAMWMAWGPELTFFCNDAYLPTLGVKEPWALGAPATKVWEEIWPDIGPRIDHVLRTGEATWDEGLLLYLQRSGYPEETYHTFSYSPLSDDAGNVRGMLCVVTEETDRIIGARRLAVLRDLAAELSTSNTVQEVGKATEHCLAKAHRDLPFALVYMADPEAKVARLLARSGLAGPDPGAPAVVDCNLPGDPWPLPDVLASGEPVVVEGAGDPAGAPARDGRPPLPQRALLLPLVQPGASAPFGVLVAGLTPHRPLDDAYRSFAGLFSGQLASGIVSARAYEAERRRAEALTEIDRAKTAFFSNVSHEFRTPLTLMLGPLADALGEERGKLSPRAAEELSMAHRNALRLLKLVNSLLDFSRIEAGRVQASYQAVDLAGLTSDLASVFRSATDRAGLSLTIDAPRSDEPAYVDPDMWEKVVLNLISNAFKFTLGGGITVRLAREGRQFKFRVTDTGSGVPAEELPRLFERFHRVEGTPGRTHEGSGIGLALVQELVKLHGGTVEAESKVGVGSTFTVSIPAGKDHLPADRLGAARTLASTTVGAQAYVDEAMRWLPEPGAGEAAPEGVSPDLGGGQSLDAGGAPAARAGEAGGAPLVLVVDDNADMRDYLRRLLAQNHQVAVAVDGRDALAVARRRAPDLILSDVMMPNLDGFGLLAAVRADARLAGVPLVLLSARAGEEATLEGIRAGADDYIVKPFSAKELLARVDAQIERKRFERKLAATEQRLEQALQAARMAAWEWDPDSDAVRISSTVAEVFGLRAGETIPSTAIGMTYVHPDDVEALRGTLSSAARDGKGYSAEFRIVRPLDGKVAWMEERARYVEDQATGRRRMVGLVADVTARKEAELELRRNAGRAEFALRLDEAMRSLSDPDQMSRAAAKLLAEHFRCERAMYAEVEADEDTCSVTGEFSPDVPAVAGRYRISEYGRSYSASVRANRSHVERDVPRSVLSAEEKERFAKLQVASFITSPLFKNGRLVALFVVHSDRPRDWSRRDVEDVELVANRCWEAIERGRVLRELSASEERLGMAVESAQLGTFYCPVPLGKIIWNEKCHEHFWLPPDAEVDVERFYSILHPEDRERTRHAVEAAVFDRRPYDVEYRTVSPAGAVRWIRAMGRAYYDSAGAPTRFDGVTVDISHSKAAEQRREEVIAKERAAREEVERVSRMKDEFLATLSHELRTPLNAILGWSQILQAAPPDSGDLREGLSVIERNTRAQTQLIEDLLDMSRIVSGKVRLDVQRLSLADAVTAAVDTVRPSAEVRSVRLETVLDPHAGPVVGDVNRLQQVLWNLLSNAIKFTPKGGKVQVVLERVNSHLEVSVADTGEGIDPDFLPHVFERFRQADSSTTRRHGGLGLGLNIVKNLVELHGGAVRAKSAGRGLGSTFTISLPLAVARIDLDEERAGRAHPRAANHGGDASATIPQARLEGASILVVDDDADARGVIRKILTSAGAKVLLAGSSAEGLGLLRQSPPDLILSDIGMPGEDGYEFIRKARQQGSRAPAIALTAFARSEDRRRALFAGFQTHVAKPVEPAELVAVCASLTGRMTGSA